MSRRISVFLVALAFAGAGRANAQETPQSPGTLEVSIMPGGAMFFTGGSNGPSFGNYQLGGSVAYNFNRIVGVEGEVGDSIGISQSLHFSGRVSCPFAPANTTPVCGFSGTTPNLLNYSGNVIANLPGGPVVPYATGGIGGLTAFSKPSVGATSTDTFFTLNVGGGVKWYAPSGRWGLRGDYRFIGMGSKSDASAFFGQDNRYAHRFYGAVIINALR
jgi:Outer membrane protein beta-barrel domain